MALDFSYYNALTSGYQNSQQRRAIRQQEENRQLQQLQMLQQQQQQNVQNQQQMQQQIMQAEQLVQKITGSKFGRQKDIDDMKKWSSEYSGWNDIKQIIKDYNGDYTAARTYGNLDHYVNLYKMKINNPDSDPMQGNPILQRVQQNTDNLTQFLTTYMSPEDRGLLFKDDIINYQKWQAGEIDDFVYNGQRNEYDIESLMEATTRGTDITVDDMIDANINAVIHDASRITGLPAEHFMNNRHNLKQWFVREMGINQNVVGVGQKDISTDYASEFKNSLEKLPKHLGDNVGKAILTVEDIYDLEDEGVTLKQLFELPFEGTFYSDNWERMGGYNSGKQAHSKLGGTNLVYQGHQGITSGQILTDRALQVGVLKSQYGERYSPDGTIQNLNVNGLYAENGNRIGEDDIANPNWNFTQTIFGYEQQNMDFKYNGTFIGMRIKFINNQSGKEESILLTRDSDASDIKKIREQYGDKPVEFVMINELIDEDALSSDDPYYDVIELDNVAFRQELNKNTNPEGLSAVINQSLSNEEKIKLQEIKNKKRLQITTQLADVYTNGDNEVLDQVAQSYSQSIGGSLVISGFDLQESVKLQPIMMSYLLAEAERISEGDTDKVNENFRQMTTNLPNLLNTSNYQQMRKAMQEGPDAFINFLKKNMDKKTFSKFTAVNRDWNKYFRLSK